MAGAEYKVVFEGKRLPRFEEEVVRKEFARLFDADEVRLNRLFSGKPYAIRKAVPEKEARKYEHAIYRIGGVCRIISMDGKKELPPLDQTPSNQAPFNRLESVGRLVAEGRSEKRTKEPFNWFGRIGRVRFLALCWVVAFIEVAAVLLPGYLSMLFGTVFTIQETVSMVFGVHMLAVILMFYLVVTRLHDINRTGWLWPFLLIPGANLLFLFWLIFMPGTNQANLYGSPPPTASNVTRAIGVYLPVSLILLTVAGVYLHQEEVLVIVQNLPEQLLEWTDLEYR